jgi:hypothetical protein
MSRDQSLPLLISFAYIGFYKRLAMYFLRHAMRLFLFTNNTRKNNENPKDTPWKLPDITGPEFFSVYLRSHPVIGYMLYPLLCILDLELLIGSVLWNYREKNDDIIQHSASLIFSNLRVRTPVSWLATKVIKKQLIIDKLTQYWCGWRKSCYFVSLYEPLLDRIMK